MSEQLNNQPQDDNLQGHNSALINAKFSDAASETQRDIERELDADAASAPSYELHLENESRLKEDEPLNNTDEMDIRKQEQTGRHEQAGEQPAKLGEEKSGMTNLSSEQLREEGGSAS